MYADLQDILPTNFSPPSSPTLRPQRPIPAPQSGRAKKPRQNNPRTVVVTNSAPNPFHPNSTIYEAIPRAIRKRMNKREHDENSAAPNDGEVITTPCSGARPEYYFENGLRKVRPYHFTYNTYAKARWLGRPILEVYGSEFRDRPFEYYKNAFVTGQVLVNGKPIPPELLESTLVNNGDLISHTAHRHETAVSDRAIGIIYEDDELMAIDKPSGVPVHPAGRYRFNSITEILRSQRDGFDPLPCNRLDRLTSGIMFIGKTPRGAERFSAQLKERAVRKEYVARVLGEFPEGEVVCDQPILQISPKLGLNAVRAHGKEARTVFRRVAYYPPPSSPTTNSKKASDDHDEPGTLNGSKDKPPRTSRPHNEYFADDGKPWKQYKGYSIVRCFPLTGRTHQIRVHLQFLGHPIANDPIYANQRVWGPALGRGRAEAASAPSSPKLSAADTTIAADVATAAAEAGAVIAAAAAPPTTGRHPSDQTLITRLELMGKTHVAEAVAYHDELVDSYHARKAELLNGQHCPTCATPLYSDPGAHELGIYLHARRYASASADGADDGGWAFESPWPAWAGTPPAGLEGGTAVVGAGGVGGRDGGMVEEKGKSVPVADAGDNDVHVV